MDDLDAFLNVSASFKRVPISGGHVNGRIQPKNEIVLPAKREHAGLEYVGSYQEAESKKLVKTFSKLCKASPSCGISLKNDLEDFLSDSDENFNDCKVDDIKYSDRSESVYERFFFNYIGPDLPIVSSRSEILEKIRTNPVIVVQGSTGCGKSTQLPQFILDDAYQRKEHCNIIVTQPRRIAARSIATRVCKERKWEIGTLVGYQVGLNTVSSDDTRILFCTTGILLEKLIRTKTMDSYTHIILDEVHERDQNMDFLFIVVRRLLATNSPNCKVILMSATIEAPIFAEYFKLPRNGGRTLPAPIVNVEPRRPYVVREFYLCQLQRLNIDANVSFAEPGIQPGMYEAVRKLVIVAKRIDGQDQIHIPEEERLWPTILIFLPGILEIEMMYKMLEGNAKTGKYTLFPLHSSITLEEQQNVFRSLPNGDRKIVLCTNIAESSITIPDVKYVIDLCLTKHLKMDTTTNFQTLQLCWASRNNCIQRSGRAGRVMDGRVYRMVPKIFFDEIMPQSAAPEILRSPLEKVVLKAKMLDMGPPESILALAMDQPDLSDIQNTILLLKEMGAMLRTSNGVFLEDDGDLTFMGRVMATLPVDIRVARLIIFGHCFSVLEECIIIGAGLNVKSIFNNPFSQAVKAYSNKMRWSDGSGSDLFAILKAYKSWIALHHQNNFNDPRTEREWTKRYFLQVKSLKEMAVLVNELTDRLDRLGIREPTGAHRLVWSPGEKSIFLKCVIFGAFFPNIFFRMPHSVTGDRDSYNTLCGRDPTTTVFFSGFPHKYIGELYRQSIKNIFKDFCTRKNVHVSFDRNTEKIFVSFRRQKEHNVDEYLEAVPGGIATEVYKAVKLRRSTPKGGLCLNVMHPKEALEVATQLGLGHVESGAFVPKRKMRKNMEMIALPRAATKEVRGQVTYFEGPHCFYVRSREEELLMRNIHDELNAINSDLEPFESVSDIVTGQLLATLYEEEFHRARVICFSQSQSGHVFRLRLVDIGKYIEVPFCDLRCFRGVSAQFADIPSRAFECRLAELKPSMRTSEKSVWTRDAIQCFGDSLQDEICVQVFSVVDRVANVVLISGGVNVNEFLVTKGHAEVSEENFKSKEDHVLRVKRQQMKMDLYTHQLDSELLKDLCAEGSDDESDADVVEPNEIQCYLKVNLSGPFSPLEAKVYGACGSANNKSVQIEPHSVNSVLLEDRSQDVHNSIIVAATVTCSERFKQLTARETTLMPNIPGFGALMALIFAPYVEYKQDRLKTRYTSLLCGLGYNEKAKRPIYEEHDVRFEMDVDINKDDLRLIDQIRFAMDSKLFTKPGEEMPKIKDKEKHNNAKTIKTSVLLLLEKERQRLSAQTPDSHTWGYADDVEVVPTKQSPYGDWAIFPFHASLRMRSADTVERMEQMTAWQHNCAELHRLATLDFSLPKPIMCKVCQISFNSVSEIKIHLYSRMHLDREHYVGFVADC